MIKGTDLFAETVFNPKQAIQKSAKLVELMGIDLNEVRIEIT